MKQYYSLLRKNLTPLDFICNKIYDLFWKEDFYEDLLADFRGRKQQAEEMFKHTPTWSPPDDPGGGWWTYDEVGYKSRLEFLDLIIKSYD